MLLEPRTQHPVKPQRDVRVLRRVGPRVPDRDLVEGELLRALAGDVLVVDGAVPEVLERERVHVVPRRGAVEHVGLQHGVELDSGQVNAGPGEHAHVVLQVLADLGRAFRFEDRAELPEHHLGRELGRRARVVVPEGNVGGTPGLDRERHPDQVRAHVVEARGLGVERDRVRRAEALDPGVEGGFVEHRLVLGGGGLRRCVVARVEELAEPGPELELPVEGLQRLRVRLDELQVERTDLQGHVAEDRDQFLRERYLRKAAPQVLPDLALDLVRMRDDVLERPVLGEPLRSGLGPDLGDSGHVVHRIADEREVVDDGLRRHPELGRDAGRVEHRIVQVVDHGDVLAHELSHVLVPGAHQHIELPRPGLLGEGADDVVRLHSPHHQHREPERAHDGVDGLDLGAQLHGHGRTVGLVLRVEVVAERLALRVEDHRRELGLHLRLQPFEHVRHAVRGAGRLPLGVGEGGHRVERAIQVRGAVHQDETAARRGHGSFA